MVEVVVVVVGGLSSEQTVPAADLVWDLVTEHHLFSPFTCLKKNVFTHPMGYFGCFFTSMPQVGTHHFESLYNRSKQSIILKWQEMIIGFIAIIWEAAHVNSERPVEDRSIE